MRCSRFIQAGVPRDRAQTDDDAFDIMWMHTCNWCWPTELNRDIGLRRLAWIHVLKLDSEPAVGDNFDVCESTVIMSIVQVSSYADAPWVALKSVPVCS